MKKPTILEQLSDIRFSLGFRQSKLKLAVAININKIMKVNGISKSDLAASLGCRPSYVTKIFQGDTNLTIDTMVKVGDALDKDIRIIFDERKMAAGINKRWLDEAFSAQPRSLISCDVHNLYKFDEVSG